MRPPNFGRGFRRTSGGISRIVKELVPGSFNIFGMFFSLSVEFLKLSFFSRSLAPKAFNQTLAFVTDDLVEDCSLSLVVVVLDTLLPSPRALLLLDKRQSEHFFLLFSF